MFSSDSKRGRKVYTSPVHTHARGVVVLYPARAVLLQISGVLSALLIVLRFNHQFDISVYQMERLYYIHTPHAFSHWIFKHKPRLAGIPSYAHQFPLLNV